MSAKAWTILSRPFEPIPGLASSDIASSSSPCPPSPSLPIPFASANSAVSRSICFAACSFRCLAQCSFRSLASALARFSSLSLATSAARRSPSCLLTSSARRLASFTRASSSPSSASCLSNAFSSSSRSSLELLAVLAGSVPLALGSCPGRPGRCAIAPPFDAAGRGGLGCCPDTVLAAPAARSPGCGLAAEPMPGVAFGLSRGDAGVCDCARFRMDGDSSSSTCCMYVELLSPTPSGGTPFLYSSVMNASPSSDSLLETPPPLDGRKRCGWDRLIRFILTPSVSSFGSTRIPTDPPGAGHRWFVSISLTSQCPVMSNSHRRSPIRLSPDSAAAVTFCTLNSYSRTFGSLSTNFFSDSRVIPRGAQTSMPTAATPSCFSRFRCMFMSRDCAYVTLPGNCRTARVTSLAPLSMYTGFSDVMAAISKTETQAK